MHEYLRLLRDVVRAKNIRSVVDIGCGDWALAATIDWSGISYIGVDVVPELIERLNQTYGRENVRFVCADLISDDLPAGELCVTKDVLQHLANDSVAAFLSKLRQQFKYAVITNDISHEKRGGWRSLWHTEEIAANSPISNGGYRPLSLTEEPFHLQAERLVLIPLRFRRPVFGHMGSVLETKEVLLWEASAEQHS